jgi:hypothetical protein
MGSKEIKPDIFAGLGKILTTYNEIFTNTEPDWKFTPFQRVSRLEGFDNSRVYQIPYHENLMIDHQFGNFVGLMANLLHGSEKLGSITVSEPVNRSFLTIKRAEEIIHRASTDKEIWKALIETTSAIDFDIAKANEFATSEFVRDFASRRAFIYDSTEQKITFKPTGDTQEEYLKVEENNKTVFGIVFGALWKELECKQGMGVAMKVSHHGDENEKLIRVTNRKKKLINLSIQNEHDPTKAKTLVYEVIGIDDTLTSEQKAQEIDITALLASLVAKKLDFNANYSDGITIMG